MSPTHTGIYNKMLSCLCLVILLLLMISLWDKQVDLRLVLGLLDTPGRRARLCIQFQGRLGNSMFQFASLYGIAKAKNMTPFMKADNILLNYFDLDGVVFVTNDLCDWFSRHTETRNLAFDKTSVQFSNNSDIRLHGFYQSWKYFSESEKHLRNRLIIKNSLLDRASSILREWAARTDKQSLDDVTLVGIHVRRGDYLEDSKIEFGYAVAPKEYIWRAMRYYRSLFPNVLFVVCSDDIAWCKEHISGPDVIFSTNEDPGLDMATLSLCSHSVITVGSFGWWTAWLTNGTTVYYKHPILPGTKLDLQYSNKDYFPPSWIAMS